MKWITIVPTIVSVILLAGVIVLAVMLGSTRSDLSNIKNLLTSTQEQLLSTRVALAKAQADLANDATSEGLFAALTNYMYLSNPLARPMFTVLGGGGTFRSASLGTGTKEMEVTATVENDGEGAGVALVTATATGPHGSQSGSVFVYLDQGQRKQVNIIIPNVTGDEYLSVTATVQ